MQKVRYSGRSYGKRWVAKDPNDGKFKPAPNGEGAEGHWQEYKTCPKNTLVTIRDDDKIYFGISRYDASYGYPFSKDAGTAIAEARAKKAMKAFDVPASYEGIFYGDTIVTRWDDAEGGWYKAIQRGLFGCCNVESIKTLLNYFDNINEYMPRNIYPDDARSRVMELAGMQAEEIPTPTKYVLDRPSGLKERWKTMAGVSEEG